MAIQAPPPRRRGGRPDAPRRQLSARLREFGGELGMLLPDDAELRSEAAVPAGGDG